MRFGYEISGSVKAKDKKEAKVLIEAILKKIIQNKTLDDYAFLWEEP